MDSYKKALIVAEFGRVRKRLRHATLLAVLLPIAYLLLERHLYLIHSGLSNAEVPWQQKIIFSDEFRSEYWQYFMINKALFYLFFANCAYIFWLYLTWSCPQCRARLPHQRDVSLFEAILHWRTYLLPIKSCAKCGAILEE